MQNKSQDKPLPDIIAPHLKVLFIGYNPGIESARLKHHYAHKSNRFWKLLHESGLTPYRFTADEDAKLIELGYGSTNIVDRPTKSANDISRQELKEGAISLCRLIEEIRPGIACFVGIGVYKAFAAAILEVSVGKMNVITGLQPKSMVEGTLDFVCSNPSGLNTIPYQIQLECFKELKQRVSS